MKNIVYNKILIFLTLFVLIFVPIFNSVMDPFDIFNFIKLNHINAIKPCVSKQERMTKIPQLKINKSLLDAVFAGSSKVGWSFDIAYHTYISGNKISDLTLNACSLLEAVTMAKNALIIHPEIKTVYIGVDFIMFRKSVDVTEITLVKDEKLTREEIMPLILSFDTFRYGVNTLIENITNPIPLEEKQTNKFEYVVSNNEIEHHFKQTTKRFAREFYDSYVFDENKLEILKEFMQFAHDRDVKVVLFVPQSHVYDLVNIHESGKWAEFNLFKKELAKVSEYYDFSYVNSITKEKVSPDAVYFRDAVHGTKTIGKLIAQRLYEKNELYGLYINKENVNFYIEKNDELMKEYLEKNEEVVKQIKEWSK